MSSISEHVLVFKNVFKNGNVTECKYSVYNESCYSLFDLKELLALFKETLKTVM